MFSLKRQLQHLWWTQNVLSILCFYFTFLLCDIQEATLLKCLNAPSTALGGLINSNAYVAVKSDQANRRFCACASWSAVGTVLPFQTPDQQCPVSIVQFVFKTQQFYIQQSTASNYKALQQIPALLMLRIHDVYNCFQLKYSFWFLCTYVSMFFVSGAHQR